MLTRRLALTLFLLASATATDAQDERDWSWSQVLPKSRDVKLRVGDKLVPFELLPATVWTDKGNQLEVHASYQTGELLKNEVLFANEAIEHFTDLIGKNPTDSWAYLCRSIAYAHSSEPDNSSELAARDMKEAIRLDPENPILYVNRAMTWRGEERRTNGVADCTIAIGLDPRCVVAYYERAIRSMGRKATTDFSMVLRLDAVHIPSLRNRAIEWYYLDEFDRALTDWNDLIRLEPQVAFNWCGRGIALQHLGKLDAAIASYNEATRLEPTYSRAFLDRAGVWHEKQEYAEALKDLNEAIRLDPKKFEALQLGAWILATSPQANVRDGKRAVEMAQRACELTQWKQPEYLDTLAAAHAELGQFDEAVKWQAKAIELLVARKEETVRYRNNLETYEKRLPIREDVPR